ncbi:MAG: 50S ribosomal protein L15 [Chlamydiales bacterium]|nr:50S ribosomal protein L15 [Chlamydiales bacterium]MCH9619787.1 50S ribosomal protein L15 [Chlamydiales bacterium]MCH9623393.1 50S ribosomal protein L15 [Chlamydiales bacterium]
MTTKLDTLTNSSRPKKRRKLLGRGPGSGKGKTSGRGQKGMGARSGCKKRHGYIGGGVPLHKRLPTRGFSNARFRKRLDVINLGMIDSIYEDGEVVSLETLREKGHFKGKSFGIKILAEGELTKTVSFEVKAISQGAREKLKKMKIETNV